MKLYKRTIVLCAIVFAVCVIVSCILEFSCLSQYSACVFIKDYAIGIACSIIVVYITTLLQFKFEQRKLLKSTLEKIRWLLFEYTCVIISLDPTEGTPDKLWAYYDDKIDKVLKEISNQLLELEWFSKKKNTVKNNMIRSVFGLRLKMISVDDGVHVKRIIGSSHIKQLKDDALFLANDDENVSEEIIKNYNDAQNYLNEIIEKGFWNVEKNSET